MNSVKINGQEHTFGENTVVFEDFMKELGEALNRERQVVAKVRVNGREISENEEQNLSKLSIGEIGSIEIDTANPVDLACETLGTLDIYTEKLILNVEKAAEQYKQKNLLAADTYFSRAIDGIDLFVQTISSVKIALRVGLNQRLALVEATLVSIMNDLLEAKQSNNYVFLAELLEKDLAENLRQWRGEILPLLLRTAPQSC